MLVDLLASSKQATRLQTQTKGKQVTVPVLHHFTLPQFFSLINLCLQGTNRSRSKNSTGCQGSNGQRPKKQIGCTDSHEFIKVVTDNHQVHCRIQLWYVFLSSRSHLFLNLSLEGIDSVSKAITRGRLMLVDLAGSERISRSEATGQRLVEAAAINKSLTALGQVSKLMV